MAQIDIITYSGQLVMTLISFTTLLWFVGTVVRSNTHMYVGFWNSVPAMTLHLSTEYNSTVNNRFTMFSSVFGTLVSRMVDSLLSFRMVAVKTLGSYNYKGTWKNGVVAFVGKSYYTVLGLSAVNVLKPVVVASKEFSMFKGFKTKMQDALVKISGLYDPNVIVGFSNSLDTPVVKGKVNPSPKAKEVVKEVVKPVAKQQPKPIVKEQPKPVVKEQSKGKGKGKKGN